MRRAVEVASLIVLLGVCPAIAGLEGMQRKAIERASKTLTKSRDARERREAIRTLATFEVPEVVAPLAAALGDSDPTVRRQAADALWRVSEVAAPAEGALRGVLEDPSPGVRVRAAAALDALGVPDSELVAAREAGLGAESLRDRILASRDLVGAVSAERLVPAVLEVAAAEADKSESDLGRSYLSPVDILERLGRRDDSSFVAPVMTSVVDGNPGRRWLLKGLAGLESKPTGWNTALITQLGSPRIDDRIVGLELLRNRSTQDTGVKEWIGPATAALDVPETRHTALWALQDAGGYAASAAPQIALIVSNDPAENVRKRAAAALGKIGDRGQAFPSETLRAVAVAALPALTEKAVQDPDDDVRGAALDALGRLWVTAEEVLPTYLALAADDQVFHNRFGALLRIRNLGTDAASAADDLEAIIATDSDNREMAEQALDAVRNSTPDFNPNITTTAVAAAGADTGAALAALRAAGIEFSPVQMWRALSEIEEETVRLLLDAGIDANERLDDVGMRPLHVLYFGAGCTVMKYPSPTVTTTLTTLLLERGADPDIMDDRNNTALKLAASNCDGSVVRLLIEAGADMEATDNFGATAFETAIGISSFSGCDAPEAFLDAGVRLPPETAAKYRETYADNPRILDLLNRAAAVESPN